MSIESIEGAQGNVYVSCRVYPTTILCRGFSNWSHLEPIRLAFPLRHHNAVSLLAPMNNVFTLLLAFNFAVLFTANALAQDDLPVLDLDRPLRLDFSGSWEKDFGRSDKWEDELGRMLRIRQEQAVRQQAGVSTGGPAVSLGNINLNNSRAGASIIDLARLAEYITRQTTMNIIQDRNQVRIERRGEAPLECSIESGPHRLFASEHGSEACGWDGQQLVFIITLPDDLVIQHRLSVAADREELRMVTSIRSGSGAPFNLQQTFNRYDEPAESFDCVLTLSRGRVCSQAGALP